MGLSERVAALTGRTTQEFKAQKPFLNTVADTTLVSAYNGSLNRLLTADGSPYVYSSSTQTLVGKVVIPATGKGTGCWVMSKTDYKPYDFGAVGDGTNDDTAAFNAMLSFYPANSVIRITPGNWKLTTGQLTIPSDRVTLDFTGSTINVTLPAGSDWTSVSGVIFDGNGKQAFQIVGGKWVCKGDTNNSNKGAYRVRILSAHGCSDVTLDRMTCLGCTLGRFPFGNNVRVINPVGVNTESGINYQQGGVESFLLFPFSTNFLLVDPKVDGYGHGIQWDGGPNEGSGNGFSGGFATLDQPRGVGPGKIIGGTIKNQSGGGIWGSRGYQIITSFCTVTNCGDTCWDDEGGIGCVADYCHLEDAFNAGVIGTFGHVRGCKVSNSTIKIATNGAKLGACFGSAAIGDNTGEDLTFDNNKFICTIANTVGIIGPDSQAFKSVIFTNNQFENARWYWHTVGSRSQRFEGNRIKLTVASDGPTCGSIYGSAADPSELIIRNNRVVSTANGNVGLSIYNADGSFSGSEYIESNRIVGFANDFDLKFTASNSTVGPTRVLRGNTLGAGQVVISNPSSGAQQQVLCTDNRRLTGESWPYKAGANLAVNESTFASTAITPTANLTSGKLTDYYSSDFTFDSSVQPSAGVRMRFQQQVGEVVLYPRQDSGNIGTGWPTDYAVDVSADGVNWTTVATRANQPKPTVATYRDRLFFTPVLASYARVRALKSTTDPSNGAFVFQLAELEVYAPGRSFDSDVQTKRPYTPTGSNDPSGTLGESTYDANFLYIRAASGWRRLPLNTF